MPRYHNLDVNLTQYRTPISQSNSISDCISIYIDKHRPNFYILLDDTDGFLAIIHSELTLTTDVENSTKRVVLYLERQILYLFQHNIVRPQADRNPKMTSFLLQKMFNFLSF